MKKPLVSIITVNYNELGVTCELLDSIRRIKYPNIETIVVDNASKQNPEKYLTQHYPEVQVIVSEENLGFAGGNNLGVKVCKGEYLFFVNSDAELTEGAIETLLALFGEIPKLGMVSPLLCYYNDKPKEQADIIQYVGSTPVHPMTARNKTLGELEEDRGQYQTARPTAYVHGAAMMVPRHVIEEAGMMSEKFFLYYEELDWTEKVRRAGYDIYVEPRAKIYHKESISVGKMSTLKTYYINRNRILFMRRNKTAKDLFAFVLFLIFATIPKNALVFILKGQFDHLNAFLKGIWWNVQHRNSNIKPSPPSKKSISTSLNVNVNHRSDVPV